MILFLNPAAGGGKARARLARLAPLLASTPHEAVTEPATREALLELAPDAMVVAAGGDGTLHTLVNALMDPGTDAPCRPDVRLGAIGLGSSNDAHRPAGPASRYRGAGLRLDPGGATRVDLGRMDAETPEGTLLVRYFLLNASAGALAIGNAAYNAPTGVQAALKRLSPGLAMLYGFWRGLRDYAPLDVELAVEDGPWRPMALGNLGLVKHPYFCGGLRYAPEPPPAGLFGCYALLAPDRRRFAWALGRLALTGRFRDTPWGITLRPARVALRFPGPEGGLVELDGEIYRVKEARFRVVPEALTWMGPGLGRTGAVAPTKERV